ncbi:hypothetical protein Tco_0676874 [Tanacetum coccineum]
MHNNIMAAGSKDRPPMLGPGRYSQWRSRFLRYIDTKGNGEYLRKCIFEGPYKLTSVVIEAVAATVNSPEVPQHDEAETVHNMSAKNKPWIHEQAQRIRIFKEFVAHLAKYFKKLYNQPTKPIELLQTPRNKTEHTTPSDNMPNSSGQYLGIKGQCQLAGLGKIKGSQVDATEWNHASILQGFGHYAKECRKPKRVKDYTYHKEKMMMCKQAEQGVPLQAEQADG